MTGLFDPLNIFIVALGAGFLLPLFHSWHKNAASAVFYLTLGYMTLLAGMAWAQLLQGVPTFDLFTAGLKPPLSINLRLGMEEAFFIFFVNLAGLAGGWYLFRGSTDHAAKLVLFIILIMGVDGLIATRDLFNVFIFLEITAIATYGLIAMEDEIQSLGAGFKYIIATALASTFFLLGTILLYFLTGTLNIDDMLHHQAQITGPIAAAAGALVLTGLLIELKPYPANGWGLDVYQATRPGMAAMVSVVVSAGILFALYKVLPLLNAFLPVIIAIGLVTFTVSNLMGLQQSNARRLLGYSSIGQMGLAGAALAMTITLEDATLFLVVGGLFLNHFLAKAALFWLAGLVDRADIKDWRGLALCHRFIFVTAIAALAGFPPFPGFWAKWELLMHIADQQAWLWLILILVGSLLEAAYLFRWFGYTLEKPEEAQETAGVSHLSLTETVTKQALSLRDKAPALLFSILLYVCGYYATKLVADIDPLLLFIPLFAGALLYLLDWLPTPVKGGIAVAVMASYAVKVLPALSGIPFLFGLMLIAAGALLAVGSLYRNEPRHGFYPLLVMMVLSLGVLIQATSSLEFFFAWEVMTLTSYLLIARGKAAPAYILSYLLFSLGAAFFVLGGFAVAYAESGSILLEALSGVQQFAWLVWLLLGMGFLIKLGALGFHIWMPGAYSEAEDDFSAILAAVVSKAAIFGLLLVAVRLELKTDSLDMSIILYIMGWLGLLTATVGALSAAFQEDMKRMLAYSSMGQVGYIVTAVAMMSHLGWTTALYLAVNHVLFKGLLFLAVAGVIYRTGTRLMYQTGGLIRNMPFTFVAALVGIFAISGVPPMTGFGSKWLLYNALLEKGWYLQMGLAFFASAIAFLYLFRLIFTIFLGQRKTKHKDLREAPIVLLVPQMLLVVGIMVFSFYPKLLIEPLSLMIPEMFPVTSHWEGTKFITQFGYWNTLVMLFVIAGITMACFAALLFISRYMNIQPVKQFNIVYAAERPHTPETTHYAYNFFSFYERAIGFLIPPKAIAFWKAATEWAHTVAGMARGVYTGNGQTYALYVVLFLALVYAVGK